MPRYALPGSRWLVTIWSAVVTVWFAASAIAPPATQADSVSTSLPGGQRLPKGAVVAAVVRFDGEWIAAGADFPAGATPVLKSCVQGCNPVVWTSTDKKRWTATWGASQGVSGSFPGEMLVSSTRTLLLFLDDEGTRLWVTPNGTSWNEDALPNTMSALDIRGAVYGHGRYVVMEVNKYAGGPNTAYGESDEVWTSTDGHTWTQTVVSGSDLRFDSLTVNSKGFRLVGRDETSPAVVWTSDNGMTWKVSR